MDNERRFTAALMRQAKGARSKLETLNGSLSRRPLDAREWEALAGATVAEAAKTPAQVGPAVRALAAEFGLSADCSAELEMVCALNGLDLTAAMAGRLLMGAVAPDAAQDAEGHDADGTEAQELAQWAAGVGVVRAAQLNIVDTAATGYTQEPPALHVLMFDSRDVRAFVMGHQETPISCLRVEP